MKRVCALLAMVWTTCALWAADWPQYLGPTRDGVSPETGLARAWPATGPKVLWTRPMARGFAPPAIRDGEVYVLERVSDEQDVMRCLNLASGKESWSLALDAPGKGESHGIPTVDVETVYAVDPLGEVYCVNRKTHALVWRKNLLEQFKGKQPGFGGVAQSPTLYKDWVVMAALGDEAGLVALDKKTGEVGWTSPAVRIGGFVSPRLVTIDGVDQFVTVTFGKAPGEEKGGGRTTAVDANTGKVLWSYDGYACNIPIVPPTPLSDGRLLLTGGYNAGAAMIQVKKQGDTFTVTELWKNKENMNNQCHPPLLFKDLLYVNSNSMQDKEDGMKCLTQDGEVKWATGATPTLGLGSSILADGLIIVQESDTGSLRLMEPNPAGYKELACVGLNLSKRAYSALALSDGKLVLRDQTKMMCLDLAHP